MISRDEDLRGTATEQAAEWFTLNDDDPLDEQQSAALVSWLKASPLHVEEFLGVSVIARDLRAACSDPQCAAATLLAIARSDDGIAARPLRSRIAAVVPVVAARHRQVAALSMAVIVGAAVTGPLWWPSRPATPPAAPGPAVVQRFDSRHGERQTHQLPDGSVLRLNTDTSVTVRYDTRERLVTLIAGEAAFEVAHRPDRPFRVLAGSAAVVDMGTRFDVRLEGDATRVTVAEGRVAVGRSPAAAGHGIDTSQRGTAVVYLGADQQLLIGRDDASATPVSVDAQRTTAWLRGQIVFQDEPLERVASEFNRYGSKPVEISSPELRTLRIGGVFATDNSAAFVAFLRGLDGVRVEVTDQRIVVSHK